MKRVIYSLKFNDDHKPQILLVLSFDLSLNESPWKKKQNLKDMIQGEKLLSENFSSSKKISGAKKMSFYKSTS